MTSSFKFEITFIVIATGEYYQYFHSLLSDIEKCFTQNRVQILVFTDRKENLKSSDFHLIEHVVINPEPWPEITLLRFSKLLQFENRILGDYIVWTDADMRIVRFFNPKELLSTHGIKLSRHPGFSLNIKKAAYSVFKRPLSLLDWLNRVRIIKEHRSSLQGWEVNIESSAYVEFGKRRTYVQGGFWLARKEDALLMCSSIQQRILIDLKIPYVPVYHDETYLNWYMANFRPALLPKDFVGVEGYLWQATNKSFVMCVDKSKVQLN